MSLIPVPRLIRVTLRSVNGEVVEDMQLESVAAEMEIQRNVDMEVMADVEGQPKGRVIVKLDVVASGYIKGNREKKIISFDGKYAGYFEANHPVEEISAEIAKNPDYAEKLLLQIFPVASLHFRNTLSLLGANMNLPVNAF